MANYTGCQAKLTVQHLAHVLADQLMSHSQISFNSLLDNLALELCFFSLKINAMLAKKVGFQTA